MTERAITPEDQFFREQEAERRRIDAWNQLQQGVQSARAEHARIKSAQQRRCPTCRIALEVFTLRGVEVDRCGLCKGIWLDDGELELLCRPRLGFLARLMKPFRRMADKSDF